MLVYLAYDFGAVAHDELNDAGVRENPSLPGSRN